MKHVTLPILVITGLVGCTSGDVILNEPQNGVIPQNLDSRRNPGCCGLLHQVFHPG